MNKITEKLILGISSIVLISTALIIGIFMSQYKDMLLDNEKAEIVRKADEIAMFSNSVLESKNQLNYNSPISRLINGLIDSNLWIFNSNDQLVLSTTDIKYVQKAMPQILKDSSKISSTGTIITFNYSNYLDDRYISVVKPIYSKNSEHSNGTIIGYLVLHKQIDNIYKDDDSLFFLVFISILISIILSIVLGIAYSLRFTKPIQRMTYVAKQISEGNYKIKTNIIQNDEIGVLAETLDKMTEKLDANISEIKRLEESAKELVANVSHEFKTPLTIIRGHIENLQEGVELDSAEVYNRILNNTKVLDRLVNELLDLNKYQNGRVDLKIEQLELVQIMRDVESDIKTIASLKDIQIVTKIKGGDIKLLEADYVKFKQLITIVLDNAIKFSPNKSKIDIIIEDNKITIKDYGKGIKKDDLEHIFERFYRSDENNEGYGLGLCIAKYIADRHGFKIEVSSVINKGTKVTILL